MERADGLHPPDAAERAAARRGVETARGAAVDSLFDAATAFWRSATLFAACEIGLFDALQNSPAAVAQLAERTGASRRGLEALLPGCLSMDLVECDGTRWRNTPDAARYLTSTSPDSILVSLQLQAATFPMWSGLADAVRKGAPVVPPGAMLGRDPELTRRLIIGMHQRARLMAEPLSSCIDLDGRRLLVDVGGGPGTLSVMLARKYPALRARVLDLPPVIEIARPLIADSGVADRVEVAPFDATRDELPEGYDAALVCGLLHRMAPDGAREILGRVGSGLAPGGILVVSDLFAHEDAPAMPILFGLQMLLTTTGGRTHAAADVAGWLRELGLVDISTTPLPPPVSHTVVSALKRA
ncbi:MAG: methyltransferase [Planctomycetota bacterium]|jgi:2-polyprenyl-3-methyl-5-hydroxy-6-metoxy-1,4-benzoquinol methylase